MERGVKYVTVSIPSAIADRIDTIIEELGYWPSRSAFVREACLEKIRGEMLRIGELKEATAFAGSGGGSSHRRPRKRAVRE